VRTGSKLAWILAGACAVGLGQNLAVAQSDEGPILRPRVSPRPVAKPAAGATLLVICDLACNWKLDGKARGRIAPGDPVTAPVSMGQHLVDGATADGLDKVEDEIEIKTAGQTIVRLALQSVREVRLKAEGEAAQQKADRVVAEKAVQEAKDQAAREQQTRDDTARLQELRDHAAERSKEAWEIYGQKRYVDAAPLFQKACDGGEMTSCRSLGIMYNNGLGVSLDYAQALALSQKACDGGEMLGCANLGLLNANGQGVTQDFGQARKLFQKACDGGAMTGCANLGVIYDKGLGVTKDYAQARTLYKRACDGGFQGACESLSNMR